MLAKVRPLVQVLIPPRQQSTTLIACWYIYALLELSDPALTICPPCYLPLPVIAAGHVSHGLEAVKRERLVVDDTCTTKEQAGG